MYNKCFICKMDDTTSFGIWQCINCFSFYCSKCVVSHVNKTYKNNIIRCPSCNNNFMLLNTNDKLIIDTSQRKIINII